METVKQEELVHIDLWAVVRRMMPILRRLWALILALAVLIGFGCAAVAIGALVEDIELSLLVGDNMRRAVPWVAIGGAGFVLACDIFGRVVRAPYEIPISVVVGVAGAGIFLYLLLRKRRGAGS